MKPTKKLYSLFVIIGLLYLPVYAQDNVEGYSIKNRWNTKLSLSVNRNNEWNDPVRKWLLCNGN